MINKMHLCWGYALFWSWFLFAFFCIIFRGEPSQPSTIWGMQPPSVGDGWGISRGGEAASPLHSVLRTSPPLQALAPHVRPSLPLSVCVCTHMNGPYTWNILFQNKSHPVFQQLTALKCWVNISSNLIQLSYSCRRVNSKQWGWYQ